MRLYCCSRIYLFAFGLFLAIFVASCTVKEYPQIDIPQGMAASTLKEFARQANVELLFDRQIADGVETNAVKGRYDPRSALRIMLEETPLEVDVEEESGAYAIYLK